MIFAQTKPVAAGYFQCDLNTRRPPRDAAKHAGLLYVASGQGEWTMGPWKFPIRRGDFFALPLNMTADANVSSTRPLGYFFCYFKLDQEQQESLEWPWDLGLGAN